jgi:hypothetical protein
MRTLFKKRQNVFIRLIHDQALLTLEGLEALKAYVETQDPAAAKMLTAKEKEADEARRILIDELNRTFVTPFDREDIAFLMRRLDDVVDFSWAASVRLQAFSIETITETAISFGRIICRQAEILSESLVLLRKRHQMKEILGLCREVHALENEADVVLRGALAKRYNATPHTIEGLILAMKWSEIYGILEKASDRAEDIADTLQSIVLKYA